MLQRLRLRFDVVSPDVDESPLANETPEALALRLSVAKAQAVSRQHPDCLVIGSDQVATIDGRSLGKPGTHAAAVAQLQQLSGREVVFHTALTVTDGRSEKTEDVITTCVFRELSDTEIQTYLLADQPYDTAGSAKAEMLGIALMQRISSDDPTAIVGLPLIALSNMLRHFGLNPVDPPAGWSVDTTGTHSA